jgi:acyl carrier protein
MRSETRTPTVVDLLARLTYTERERFIPSASLTADLGFDSLDLVELAMDVERVYNVDVDDDTLLRWRTVGDVQAFVARISTPEGR